MQFLAHDNNLYIYTAVGISQIQWTYTVVGVNSCYQNCKEIFYFEFSSFYLCFTFIQFLFVVSVCFIGIVCEITA